MRALLIVPTAAALVLLAGCGQKPVEAGSTLPESTKIVTEEPPVDVVPPVAPGGKPQDPGATPEPPVSKAPSATGYVVPAGVTQLPPEQVDATALPPLEYDERGLVWVFDDGFSLQMFAMATSGCGGVEARVVDQTATQVRITLGAMEQPQGGSPDDTMCTTALTPKPVTVTLDAPLKDRTVFLASGR